MEDNYKDSGALAEARHEGRGDNAKSVPAHLDLAPYDPLQIYLSEISQYELLTREEEKKLFVKVREHNDERAARRLIASNLRLVVRIALEFQRNWSKSLLDLIQEGNLGLLKAVRKFDPYRGVKFSYYASFWIKAYMLKFVMDNFRLLKIGTTQNQRKLFFNLAKARDKLLAEGLRPEPGLLAERLDVKEEEVVEMTQRLGAWEMSLDSPVGHETEKTYGSILTDPTKQIDEQISERQKRELLKRNLGEFRNTLSGKEADIFDKRIMAEKPLTLQQLGEKHHISRERVRQIQNKIIGRVRKRLQKQIPNFRELYTEDTAAASG